MNTGEVIKYLRKQKGLSQQELADRIGGVSRSAIQKMEGGVTTNLKLDTIQKLCEIFQVAPYAFVYPDIWERHQKFYESDSTIHEMISSYIVLSTEGKQKTLSYMKDLSKINQYIREDTDKCHNLGKLFPWIR